MSVSAVVMAIKLGTENGQRVCYEHYLPVYLQIILIGGVVYGCMSCSNCPLDYCPFGLQVCILKVACVHPPPPSLRDFYEGGRQMCPLQSNSTFSVAWRQ